MKLSIPERIRLLGFFQDFKGSIIDLRVVNDLVKDLGFSEKELKDSKLKYLDNRITWDEKFKDKDIKFGDRATELISEILEKKDKSGDLVIGDITLWEKFMEVE